MHDADASKAPCASPFSKNFLAISGTLPSLLCAHPDKQQSFFFSYSNTARIIICTSCYLRAFRIPNSLPQPSYMSLDHSPKPRNPRDDPALFKQSLLPQSRETGDVLPQKQPDGSPVASKASPFAKSWAHLVAGGYVQSHCLPDYSLYPDSGS